ncbi:MAG: SBBP repeat-containing protein [Acidobacteriota bacterium]
MLLGCLAGAAPPEFSPARRLLDALPLRFEPNAGRLDPRVQFSARAAGYSVLLTGREVLLRFPGSTLSLTLAGANAAAHLEGVDPLASRSNYLLGNRRQDWRTAVPHYRGVRSRSVYPGIDVVYYGGGEGLEYDFVLAPGADPRRIRMRFRGHERLSLTRSGDLRLQAGGREWIQKRAVAYQEQAGVRHPVECRYRLLGGSLVGVEPARYDRSRPLVIDPELAYGSFLGSAALDSIIGVRVDNAGMVYVAGYTASADLTTTPGSYQESSGGNRDIFVAKLDPSQSGPESLLYFTYLGGDGPDTPTAMTMDAEGNLYLTGWTRSSNFPPAGNAPQTRFGGGQDAFVVKLNPAVAGQFALVFSTYLGGSALDVAYGIDVDAAGAIYVAGATKSNNWPLAGLPIQDARWGDQDGFLVKYNPQAPDAASAFVYSSYLGGGAIDEARGIAAAPDGRVYVTGTTFSPTFYATGHSFRPTYNGGGDVFVTHLDLSKGGYDALVYSTFLGGAGNEEPRRMILDASGQLLITGYTLSSDFPVTPGAFQPAPRRTGQVFLTRLDPSVDGVDGLTYSTYLGGTGGEVAYDLASDSAGNVYLTGYTLSSDFPVTERAFQSAYGGGVDVFCTVLNLAAPPERALVYSTYFGTAGVNVGFGVAASKDGVIFLAGYAQDRRFPITENAAQVVYAGGLADGFVLALAPR